MSLGRLTVLVNNIKIRVKNLRKELELEEARIREAERIKYKAKIRKLNI